MKTFQKGVFVEGAQKASTTENGETIASKGKLEPKYFISSNNTDNELKALIGKVEIGDIIKLEYFSDALFIVTSLNDIFYSLCIITGGDDVNIGNDTYFGYIDVNIGSVDYTVSSIQITGEEDSVLTYDEENKALVLRQLEVGTKLYKHTLYDSTTAYNFVFINNDKYPINFTTVNTFSLLAQYLVSHGGRLASIDNMTSVDYSYEEGCFFNVILNTGNLDFKIYDDWVLSTTTDTVTSL